MMMTQHHKCSLHRRNTFFHTWPTNSNRKSSPELKHEIVSDEDYNSDKSFRIDDNVTGNSGLSSDDEHLVNKDRIREYGSPSQVICNPSNFVTRTVAVKQQ